MEKSKVEDSSPSMFATVENVHKRLLRPTNSQSVPNFFTSSQHRCNLMTSSSYELQKIVENRRLEDYLDPILLCASRVKIGEKRKLIQRECKVKAGYVSDFDRFEQLRLMRKTEIGRNEAVDLKNDKDSIGDVEDDKFSVVDAVFRGRSCW